MTASSTPLTSRSAAELRRSFLDFFVAEGHTLVPSAPLVPNDPSLLFTTAGMVQFKPYYTSADVPYTRAVSVQKCLRLTDLDNVGMTPRHDTFFEMLGNFSFGPREKGAYFKEEAIRFAWEFLTQVLRMPKERLHVSVFEGEAGLPRDDEAIALWKKVGIPESRIVPLGRKDNFWGPAGGAGACGPCSEIYFDLGEKRPDYLAAGTFWGERPGDPGDRFMEFWNLVFPQFDAHPDGTLTPLPRPGIDTGMGIERLAMILQGKSIIFDTDVFEPIVQSVLERGARRPADPKAALRDARIVADHVRGLTFAIAEGALPGNEGAGYVLRRLLRRAVTRGRSRGGLAIHTTFLAACATRAIEIFGGHYHELEEQRAQILRVLEHEEAGFAETFEAGMARLEKLLEGATRLEGSEAFALHDTYGFPIELTEEIAAERGVAVDRAGFERAMDEQRERARAASKFGKGAAARVAWNEVTSGPDSEFLGYSTLAMDGLTLRAWRERPGADGAPALELVLDRTPCYAESGGQVADRGEISGGGARGALEHVYKEGERIVHRVAVAAGARAALIDAGRQGRLAAAVPASHRRPTMRHHTATHLLHAALRATLGAHVRQAGSLVAPDRLRFDYSHFEAPSGEQLATVEQSVSEWILANREVSAQILPLEEAKRRGAMALFGEKYGAEVRMVTVDGVDELGIAPSLELCGGTHVRRTGDIGTFVLVSESAIAAGVRRVEALCGSQAVAHLKAQQGALERAAAALQVPPVAVPEQIEKLKGELTQLKKVQAEAQKGGLEAEMLRTVDLAVQGPGGRWIVAEIKSQADANAVRDAADKLIRALGSGAAVTAISSADKTTLLAVVTDDLVAEKKLNASDLVKAVAKVAGGSGGGKPHLALAGAKDASKVEAALAEARRLLEEALGS
jgi:alanyl-tRNA synthetase